MTVLWYEVTAPRSYAAPMAPIRGKLLPQLEAVRNDIGYRSARLHELLKATICRVVNGIGKKREAESNGQKFQVDRPRPVRTPATVSKVKRLATTENPPSQRQLSRMCGTSLKTINNIIHKDLELDTRRKGKVHKLTPFHMKNRATNARKLYEEHLAGSRSEYTATLDEAWMYVTYCNGIRKICYIKRGNQVPDNWVHQCSETFPKGFMVVGVMTGQFYIECVLKPVIEQLKDLYPGEMDKVFLHHDKASSHTSNKTQQFLQEMKDTLGLNFIRNSDIPVKSPDASPLDFYGFGMLKQWLFNRRPKTEAGLWKAAQEEWSNVSLSKVKEVFAAWKVRCREIAKKKGKHIEHMKKIHNKKRGMLTKGVRFHHDNARPHTAHQTTALIEEFGWELVSHPPYSPDVAPSDFHFFPKLKKNLGGTQFHDDDELEEAVLGFLRGQAAEFFDSGLHKWVSMDRDGTDMKLAAGGLARPSRETSTYSQDGSVRHVPGSGKFGKDIL
ncbi:hypothetical protein LAZ67_14001977 [Cordylochernes scorpioides]|uniref:Transposase n=1 Tax=Cordylochernes scorpioides TaxID=51811 RepID=A0ABY6L6J7_9ARAC|nr:hypothetical protein LAZ67_14001977 [Cordylochernes scorpioides]